MIEFYNFIYSNFLYNGKIIKDIEINKVIELLYYIVYWLYCWFTIDKKLNNDNNKSEIVLIFQGGGSLGAYECGVFKTLHQIWSIGRFIYKSSKCIYYL